MIIVTRRTGPNEIIVTFSKGNVTKRIINSNSVAVSDFTSESDAIIAALNSERIQNLIAEGEL